MTIFTNFIWFKNISLVLRYKMTLTKQTVNGYEALKEVIKIEIKDYYSPKFKFT